MQRLWLTILQKRFVSQLILLVCFFVGKQFVEKISFQQFCVQIGF